MSLNKILTPSMESIANRFIGEIEPFEPTAINDVPCLTNDKSTILQTATLDQAMGLLGSDGESLQKWMPDNLTLKNWLKEYPFLVFLQNKLKMPLPEMWYYAKGKSLVVEYSDKCYIVAPVKF